MKQKQIRMIFAAHPDNLLQNKKVIER